MNLVSGGECIDSTGKGGQILEKNRNVKICFQKFPELCNNIPFLKFLQ